jgi:leader peptidase (prepilin peptidase)/N-methyltransferase
MKGNPNRVTFLNLLRKEKAMEFLFSAARFYQDLFNSHPLILGAAAGVLGLCIGSFLIVVALRIPKQQSFIYPPSQCVHCQHKLGVFDLIPVFSFLFLRCRCRYCKTSISLIYPVGESMAAVSFALLAWSIGLQPELLPAFFLAAILTAVTMTDLKYRLIPDKIVLFAVMIGLPLRIWTHPLPLWNHLLAMVIGGGTLYAIAWVSLLLLRKEGMGGGDIKLFTFIGLMLGIKLTLLTLFAASLIGTIFGLIQIMLGRMDRERAMPFGPFICIGAILSYVWGNDGIQWYFSLILG